LPHDLIFMYKIKAWNDYALLLLTFFSTIFISTEYGTLISVGLSLVLVVKHSTYPRITIMVNFPDQAEHVEGVLVIKISEPLYFANTGQLKDRLRRLEEFGDMSVHPSEDARMSPVKNVIFDIETMEGIDASLGCFRINQSEVVNETLNGKDVLVLLTTGGEESLCYRLLAMVETGRTKEARIIIKFISTLCLYEEVKIESFSSPNPPEILSDLVIGINEVTKYLEKSISQSNNNNHMKSLISAIPKKTNNNDNNGKHQKHHHQPLNVIFVCKYDISPSHLYSHLPIMVCLEGKVLLVQLPINSINKISNNIHIKRCCCIGVKDNSKKEFSKLFNLINEGQIKPIKASWLKPFDQEINNGDDNQEDKEQLLLLNKKRKLEEDFNSNLDSNNINTTISVTATATVVNSSSTTTTNNTNEDFI
ncbi:8437_t:CDS:2, partial [Entrophospora sp. SA101]